MVRFLLTLLAFLALLYGGLCLLLHLFQRRLVYFPGPPPSTSPADHGLAFREVRPVTSDGVRIHGWFLPASEPRGAVLVCHGNAGSIEHRIVTAQGFLDMGWSVLLFDYRGYGASEGTPSEEGTYLDAVAAHDHLTATEGFAPSCIALYGESLGTAVAIELARRRPVACLIAESAITSVPDLGAELYPFFPVRWLARYRYDSRSKLDSLRIPMLFVHSPADEIVPVHHGRTLHALAGERATLLVTDGLHNDGGFLRRAAWRAEVAAFLERALAPATASARN